MAPELDLLTFPIPGLVGAMAQMFEGAGWDGLYLAIAAVQAASGGRAVLGIGRGDSSRLSRRCPSTSPRPDRGSPPSPPATPTGSRSPSAPTRPGSATPSRWCGPSVRTPDSTRPASRSAPMSTPWPTPTSRWPGPSPGAAPPRSHTSRGCPVRPAPTAPTRRCSRRSEGTTTWPATPPPARPTRPRCPTSSSTGSRSPDRVEHCVSRLSELVEAGAERLVLVPGSRDADQGELVASMGRLATEVLPRLR